MGGRPYGGGPLHHHPPVRPCVLLKKQQDRPSQYRIGILAREGRELLSQTLDGKRMVLRSIVQDSRFLGYMCQPPG